MPINKETPTRMHRRGETYVTLPSSTIAAINDATALGIIAYLLDKPADWTPRKKDICSKLSIGPAAWKKATEHLTDLGLYVVLNVQGVNGRYIDNIVSVSAVVDRSSDLGTSDIGDVGKSTPIHITDLKNITKDLIHKGFKPPTVEEVHEYSPTIDAEIFCNFYESKGWMVGKNKMKSWKACTKTWVLKSKKEKQNGRQVVGRQKSNPVESAANLRESIASRIAYIADGSAVVASDGVVRTQVDYLDGDASEPVVDTGAGNDV